MSKELDKYLPISSDQNPKTFGELICNATGNPFALNQTEEEELRNLQALEVLTPKQQAFCQNYVKNFNAAKAAEEAGYSITSCAAIGYSLLKRPEVQAYIESLREIQSHKYRHTILDQLADLYQNVKQGDIQYTLVKTDDGVTIAKPIMRENPDGTLSVHRDKPNYKIALDTLRTMAEYTLPKPQDTTISDKLNVANKYIQNNTYINNNQQQQKLLKDHINKVINHNNNNNL